MLTRSEFPILSQLPWVRLVAEAAATHALDSPLHGPEHWETVAQNGLRLGLRNGADLRVVFAFALMHDAFRESDEYDPEHGERAAWWAAMKQDQIGFSDIRNKSLVVALRDHDKGWTYGAATVGTCWDADRLDLPRVGIQPRVELLSTDEAKREVEGD